MPAVVDSPIKVNGQHSLSSRTYDVKGLQTSDLEQRLRRLEQGQSGGVIGQGSGCQYDAKESKEPWSSAVLGAANTGLPYGITGSGTTEDYDFLRHCITADDLSQYDRFMALGLLSLLQDRGTATTSAARDRKPRRSSDEEHFPACGQDNNDDLRRTINDLTMKLTSVDDRLSGLASQVQIEAQARSSMSNLYDKEFFRVGQDMTYTAQRIDGVRSEMQAEGANLRLEMHTVSDNPEFQTQTETADLRSEMQALSDAVSETIAATKVRVEAIGHNVENQKSACNDEKAKVDKLSKLLDGKLKTLSETLNTRNAAVTSMRETYATDMQELRLEIRELSETINARNTSVANMRENFVDDIEVLRSEIQELKTGQDNDKQDCAEMEERLRQAGEANVEKLKAMMVTHAGQHNSIDERLDNLERPLNDDMTGQMEELRATTTAFDVEVERLTARIANLERDVGDGMNDNRLTDLEFQVADLMNDADNTQATVSRPGHETHGFRSIQELAEALKDLRKSHYALAETCAKDWKAKDKGVQELRDSVELLRRKLEDVGPLDVDMQEINSRLDHAADCDVDILDRLDIVESRLNGLDATAYSIPTRGSSGMGIRGGGLRGHLSSPRGSIHSGRGFTAESLI